MDRRRPASWRNIIFLWILILVEHRETVAVTKTVPLLDAHENPLLLNDLSLVQANHLAFLVHGDLTGMLQITNQVIAELVQKLAAVRYIFIDDPVDLRVSSLVHRVSIFEEPR